jgi:glycosyltransferase involved in cell wall biosynthesis
MALGVPVVTTDASGAAALVGADVSAVLVSTSDDDALTRAVRRLVEDADLRRRLGRGGREQVASSLTARRMCAELERCLEALAW